MAVNDENGTSSFDVKDWFDGSDDASKKIHKPLSVGIHRNPMIARGAFGEISIGIQNNSDKSWRLVAIKTIAQCTTDRAASAAAWGSLLSGSSPTETKPPKLKLSREVFHEICALRRVQKSQAHPNIVQLLAVYPTNNERGQLGGSSLSLAFPYCPIDLYVALEWRRRSRMPLLPWSVIQAISFDLFSALDHCHSNDVIHCDIKPGNLLVSSTGTIQLCDFGLARPFSTESKDDSSSGEEDAKGLCTLYYRPPELLLGGVADSPAVDTYSAGLVLAELVTGVPLFRGTYIHLRNGREPR